MRKHLLIKSFLIFSFLACTFGGIKSLYAYNFSAVAPTGQTLYFTITDPVLDYVKVVYPGSSNSNPWGDFEKPTGNLEIPGMVSNGILAFFVTGIGDYAFYGCDGLAEVTISQYITSIGDYSFWNCPSLETVHFNATNCTRMYTASSPYCSVFNSGTVSTGMTPITTLTIGDAVKCIPDYAFKNSPNLTGDLDLPDELTYIGMYAFYHCSSLTGALVIPSTLVTIGNGAFNGCGGLTSFLDPFTPGGGGGGGGGGGWKSAPKATTTYSLTTIGNYAFNNCSGLTGHVSLPNSLNSLGDYSFFGCSGIEELTIGEGVTHIGDYSFWNCPSLETVHFNATNCTAMYTDSSPYCSVFNSGTMSTAPTPITTLTIGDNVGRIPNYAFKNSPNLEQTLTIPNSVTFIGDYAFTNCGSLYGELTIPNAVTSIGNYAFNGCSGFTGELTLSNQLTSIGNYAFCNCSGLGGHVQIPNSVTSLGNYSFYGCMGIEELTIGQGVTHVGDYSFWNCPSLETVHFNATNCTAMYTDSSPYCSVFNSGTMSTAPTPITTLTIGNNVNRIPNYAFKNSPNLEQTLTLPNNVTIIGDYAFTNCSSLYGQLKIPNAVTSVGNYAFHGCSGFTGILKLSNQLTSIGNYAFYNCSSLEGHVQIPNSVTSLGNYSFYGCSSIEELTIGQGVTHVGDYSFWNCPSLETVHFNATNCTAMYTDSSPYCSVFNSGTMSTAPTPITTLTIGSNVNRIPNYAFKNSPNLEQTLTIPNNVAFIGDYAFTNCGSLYGELTIPNAVTSIGNYAFNGCSGFTGELTLSNQLTSIGNYAFCNCSGLEGHVQIPNPVTSLGDYSFYGCSSIEELTIGQGVTHIGDYSFWNCPSLETVHFNATNCTSMYTSSSGNYSVFSSGTQSSDLSFITTLTIGNNVNRIPNYAFKNIPGIQGVGFPQVMTIIGTEAFKNCTHISSITLRSTVPPTVNTNAFTNVHTNIPVFVPCGLVETYSSANGWSQFSNIIESCDDQIITAVYPPEGGTVSGGGTFNPEQFNYFVLSAYPNPGYSFVNWTKDGVEVFTDPIWGFSPTEAGCYVANFALIDYDIIVSANPPEGGSVEGSGVFHYGDTASLSAVANEGCSFTNWTENDHVVSVNPTYSFTVTRSRNLVANFLIESGPSTVTQTFSLSAGVNWCSFYVETSLSEVENALTAAFPNIQNNQILQIQSQTENVKLTRGQWRGELTTLDFAQMYIIIVPGDCQITLEGLALDPAAYPITLEFGVSWIGYPVNATMTLDEAFAPASPVNDDIVQSQEQNSKRTRGQWRGELQTLQPGQGYMYQSATTGRTFTFPANSKASTPKDIE